MHLYSTLLGHSSTTFFATPPCNNLLQHYSPTPRYSITLSLQHSSPMKSDRETSRFFCACHTKWISRKHRFALHKMRFRRGRYCFWQSQWITVLSRRATRWIWPTTWPLSLSGHLDRVPPGREPKSAAGIYKGCWRKYRLGQFEFDRMEGAEKLSWTWKRWDRVAE